ncbi:MAG: zinc ribbon domain-containing protein [Clostridia bacterium]|nr:zinc ribbon domain-containing protein [Clostridia bacterium]
MKILIWAGCCLLYGVVDAFLASLGISLGAIPTVLLLGVIFSLGKWLCGKWEYHIINKNYKKDNSTNNINQKTKKVIKFCRKCGQEVPENQKICSRCGTGVIEVEVEEDF